MKYAFATVLLLLLLAGCKSSGCDDCTPSASYPEHARWWK